MKKLQYSIFIILLLIFACGGAAKKDANQSNQQELDSFSAYRAYDFFIKGDLYEQSGNLNQAIEMYRKALIYDPKSIEIRRTLSHIYLRLMRFNEAAVLRSEIPEKSSKDYNFIGYCLRHTNDFSGAADFYKRSLELDSTQYSPRKYLAVLLQALGNNDGAERHYKKAIKYAPDKLDATLDLGSFYIKIKKYDKAVDVFKQAKVEYPTDIKVIASLAGAMIAVGDTAGADSLYVETANNNWDDPGILQSMVPLFYSIENREFLEKTSGRLAELFPDDPEMQRHYAFILFGSQKFAEAESLMITIDEKGMANTDIYYYLGRMKQFNQELPAAEGYYNKAIALNDTLSDCWVNLALTVDEQGRYEESLGIMQSAMEKVPGDTAGIMFFTSLIHSRNDNFGLARDGYSRLLESDPENIQVRFNLAAAYERLGDFDKAESHFKRILERAPDNALALNYLGYMYADSGIKLDEAKEMIEKALEIEPDNGAYLDSHAWVLYKLGRYDEAIDAMNSAIERQQDDAILFDHRGDIYAALNESGKAKENWRKALEFDPDNDTIRAKLNDR